MLVKIIPTRFIIPFYLLFISASVSAQLLSEIEATGIPNVYDGDIVWGDVDNDGDMDVVISGTDGIDIITRLYLNTGSYKFVLQINNFENVRDSDLEFADYNKDGLIDLFLTGTGRAGDPATRLYTNEGSGVFSETPTVFQNVSNGSVKVEDLDNDGNIDVVLNGKNDNGEPNLRIYTYNESRFFDAGIRLNGLTDGALEIADFNGDTKLDIIGAGMDYNGNPDMFLLTQVDPLQFIDFLEYPLGIEFNSDIFIEDLNNDGDVELIFRESDRSKINIYSIENNSFTLVTSLSSTQTFFEHSHLVDFNGDDKIDIIQGGHNNDNVFGLSVFLNESNNQFTEITIPIEEVTGESGESITPVDFDNDGDQDLLFFSSTYSGGFNIDYYYQLYLNNGDNTYSDSNINFPDIAGKVQFIDLDGELPPEVLFSGEYTSDNINYQILTSILLFDDQSQSYEFSNENIIVENGYGDGGNLADFDGDEILDVITLIDYPIGIKVFRGTGNGFELFQDLILPESIDPFFRFNSIDWVDIDGDDDLDIALLVFDPSQRILFLVEYLNENDTFEPTALPLSDDLNFIYLTSRWADIDGDNIPEVAISTTNIFGQGIVTSNGVYKRVADSYASLNDLPEALGYPDLVVEDFNGDGHPDFILSGSDNEAGKSYLATNNGGNITSFSYTDLEAIQISNAQVSPIDIDLNGTIDLIIQGLDGDLQPTNQLILNDGAAFNPSSELTSFYNGITGVVDLDMDKVLDFYNFGKLENGTTDRQLLINSNSISNVAPTTPSGLTMEVGNRTVTLSWEASTDDHTPQGNLTYNIEILKEGEQVIPNYSLENERSIVKKGNAGQSTSVTFSLDSGSYLARVQSLDNQFVASDYSLAISFELSDSKDSTFYTVEYPEKLDDPDYISRMQWSDIDLDGNLDPVVLHIAENSTSALIKIYPNRGNVLFDDPYLIIEDIDFICQIADFNNDSLPDIYVGNYILINRGNFEFDYVPTNLQPNYNFKGQVVDINSDGYVDVVFEKTVLYNLKNGTFSLDNLHAPNSLLSLDLISEIRWGDLDRDGDQDGIYVTPNSQFIMRNDGDGFFTHHEFFFPIQGSYFPSFSRLVDFDGDGDLDYSVVFDVGGDDPFHHFIMLNDGTGEFTDALEINISDRRTSPNFEHYYGPLSFVDFDGDQDLDVWISEEAFLENRDNTFYHFTEFESYNEYFVLAFADVNNDGDLDALDVGDLSPRLFDYKTSLRQVISISPPENIAVTSTANGQLISWDKPSDLSIPLQYNYALYRNDKLYISPHNTNLGFTSSRNLGNAGAGNTILLDLPEGDYTIKLQSVDLSFHKSPYIEKSFTVDLFEASEEFEPLQGIDMLNINFGIPFPTTNPRENTLVIGDLNGNGTLDILYGGYDYINNQDVGGLLINTDGNFEKISFINSFGSFTGKSTLHDLDGDGDLDIIGSFDNQTKILLNDGNASFTELDHQLPDGGCYAVGDLDMDGYNDIILSTPPIVNIPNQSVVKGSETFWVRQVSNLEFDGETKILSIGNINSTLYIRDIKLNDIDLDGDVDLFLSGSYASNVFGAEYKAENHIFRNDGSGKFSDEDELFVNDDNGQDRGNIDAEFVDVNGDHITDIITSAEESGLFIGSSEHTFTPSEIDLIKSNGEIVAGDFNGDGALDVFLPEEEDFNLLLNIGNGDFKNDFLDVLEDQSRKVLEGDFDNNGTLDILIYYDVGLSLSQVEIGKTYLYDNATPKQSPKSETPINLNASIDGNSVTLHWDHVLLPNDQTVTYNLSVINEIGRAYVTSHSLEDGSRLLAASGNTSYSNEFLLPNMPDGSYTWKVQSIDNIYRGSSFSPKQSFLICTEFEKNILSVIVPDNIGTNAEVTFQQTSPLTNVTYQWDFGDGQLSDEISPTHKYASSGKYAVSLSVTNEVGCELIFIDEVEVEDIVPVNISRLVTPNSDKKNDFLFIENIERYSSSELKIFSDTGQLIYSTTGYQNDWYATNKAGDTVTQGIYLCVLKIDQFSTEIRQTFTVIK